MGFFVLYAEVVNWSKLTLECTKSASYMLHLGFPTFINLYR